MIEARELPAATISFSTRRLLVVAGAVVFVIMVNWTYVNVVSPAYDYWGLTADAADALYMVAASFLAVLPAFWAPIALTRPTQVVYWLLYLLAIVPSCIVPFYTRNKDPDGLLLFVACISIAFTLLGFVYRLPLGAFPRPRLSWPAFWAIVGALFLICQGAMIGGFGFHFNIVSLEDVYDVRAVYVDTLSKQSRFVQYMIDWQANVINPLLIAFGLVRKKVFPIALGVAGQLLIYSISGHKAVFFSWLLIAVLWVAMRSNGRNLGLNAMWGSVGMVALAAITMLAVEGRPLLSALFLYRTLMVPGYVTGLYYDFYSTSPKAYLGHSIFRGFSWYPYQQEPPVVIGARYFDDPNTYANANLYADAYCNFGLPGIFAFTALFALILWTYDSAARGKDLRLSTLLLGIPAITLGNVGLLTTVLSKGLGLAVILVYLMPLSRATTSAHSKRVHRPPETDLRQ